MDICRHTYPDRHDELTLAPYFILHFFTFLFLHRYADHICDLSRFLNLHFCRYLMFSADEHHSSLHTIPVATTYIALLSTV